MGTPDPPDVTRRQQADDAPPTRMADPDQTVLSHTTTPPFESNSTVVRGPLESGQSFGRYHIIKLLGIGGMGAVYQAWDSELGTAVAIKVIRPEAAKNPEAAADLERRFKRELVLARQVTHKNVVRIHDIGELDGIKYITMRFVDGQDLSTVLKKEKKLPVERVLRIARSVAEGLAAAHDAGVVHRDLKPANIMVDASDEAVIMDFGIARSAAGSEGTGAWNFSGNAPANWQGPTSFRGETQVGLVMGTVEYMAPEQAKSLGVDQRTDIYAFGLILRDLLVGRDRVKGPAHAVIELQERMKAAPASTRTLDPTIPLTVDHLISKCVAPDPVDRYQTTHEIVAELARLDLKGNQLRVYRRLTPKMAIAAAALTVALLVGTWWFSHSGAPPVQPDPVSVLVADFVNGTKDPVFDGALEQALNVAIEGATFITSYSRRDAKRLAGQIKPGQAFDEEIARLVSMREGVKVVLAGAIQPRGSGYTISVKVVDPAKPEPLATATANASDKDAVLAAVGTVAAKIRSELGDVEPDNAAAGKETMTSASLDAVRDYSQAQDLAGSGKDADAIGFYQQAIKRDPNFGRAYSGLATSAYKIGRTAEASEAWDKALSLMDRMTEREKFRTLGTFFLGPGRNPDKAIDNYEQLTKRYPADGAAHNNLAIAYFNRMDFQKAIDEGRRIRDIYPKKLLYRVNYALYSMYAGDFQTATSEAGAASKEDPTYVKAYLPLAIGALVAGTSAEASSAYAAMGKAGVNGASLAAMGLADLAIYEGRLAEAETILKDAVKLDEDNKNNKGAATKHAALAEIFAAQGRKPLAVASATRAVELSRDLQPTAAAVLLEAGAEKQALAIAAQLGEQLQPQSRAYAKTIEARIALRDRKNVQAIEALQQAIKLADLWTARYLLGVAYVEAGHYVEGLAELDACQRRRGEGSAILLDDFPTFRVMAPLRYWLARAQDGVGQVSAAKDNYTAFLALRPQSASDPLVRDAQRRLKR